MKVKNLIFIAIVLVFSLQFAAGQLVSHVETHKQRIFPWQEANYTIYVTNVGDQAQRIAYSFPSDPEWSIITNPLIQERNIGPNETLETEVMIKSRNDRVDYKKYKIPFSATAKDGSASIKDYFEIFVRNPDMVLDYVPIVNVDVDVPAKLDPRNDAELVIKLDNKNRLNISDYSVRIQSEMNPENDRIITIPLGPLGKKANVTTLQYPDIASPGVDIVSVTPFIPSENVTYDTIRKQIEIIAYNDVSVEKQKEKSFLKTTETITIFNDGNVPATKQYMVGTSLFRQLFSSASPDFEVEKADGYRYLNWVMAVPPQEAQVITLKVNYRPIFIIIMLALIATGVYYLERSPIISRKDAKTIAHNKGETQRLKVLVHLKNRTGKPIDNITLVDTIPLYAELENDFAIGTMQPSKVIKNEKKGTIVKWQIPVLEPYEERIISYKINSKLNIIGPLRLSPALVKYHNKRGKVSRNYSNTVQAS